MGVLRVATENKDSKAAWNYGLEVGAGSLALSVDAAFTHFLMAAAMEDYRRSLSRLIFSSIVARFFELAQAAISHNERAMESTFRPQ